MCRWWDVCVLRVRFAVTSEELDRMLVEFRKVATDGSLLSLEDFKAVMVAIGLAKLPLGRMFDLFDVDSNGEVQPSLTVISVEQ